MAMVRVANVVPCYTVGIALHWILQQLLGEGKNMVSVRVEEIKLCWSESLRAFLFIQVQCFRKSLQ